MSQSPTHSPNEITRTREKLERSGLLKTVQDVCDSINKKAGGLVIDSHSYLPPQPIVCAFIVAKGDIDYVMQISVRHSKPLLVFLKRKWRDGPSYDVIGWVSSLFRRSNTGPRIRLEREILPEAVSGSEVENWFAYLVSGLKRRFSPRESGTRMMSAKHLRGCDVRIFFAVLLLVVYGFLFFSIDKPETAEATPSTIWSGEWR